MLWANTSILTLAANVFEWLLHQMEEHVSPRASRYDSEVPQNNK